MRRLMAAMLVVVICTPVASAKKWTDSTGNYTLEAKFIELRDGKVQLRKPDGRVLTVAIEKLNKADKEYVKTKADASERAKPGILWVSKQAFESQLFTADDALFVLGSDIARLSPSSGEVLWKQGTLNVVGRGSVANGRVYVPMFGFGNPSFSLLPPAAKSGMFSVFCFDAKSGDRSKKLFANYQSYQISRTRC